MVHKDLHGDNRRAWNAVTPVHNSHKRDQAKFFREGGSTLFPEEIDLLGDVNGQALAHLQCNCGQDTLSLSRRGARVTGVDISDRAIEFARRLSDESGIPVVFQRADVYDWFEQTSQSEQRFDVAFSSYGVIMWLSDIRLWAKGISAILKPGGRFVLVEFHPLVLVFDEPWKPRYPYSGQGQTFTYDSGIGDYVALSGEGLTPSGYLEGIKDFVNPHRGHEWHWGIADVVSALLDAGLTLTALREYPYLNGCKMFPNMRETSGGRMVLPEGTSELPLMFGLSAVKR